MKYSLGFYYLNILSLIVKNVYFLIDRLCLKFWKEQRSCIIMLHHIRDDDSKIQHSCVSTIKEFEYLLDYLNRNYKFVSLDDLIDLRKQKLLKNHVVITFDDGTDNLFFNAYPILKKRKIPFTVYITIDFIGKKGFLTEEQLTILNNDDLCTIGSHTISHPKLRCKDCNSLFEIKESKKIISQLIKSDIKHFAYPYGTPMAITYKNIKQVKRSGYLSAVSAIPGILNKFSLQFRFYLPRIHSRLFIEKYIRDEFI